MKYVATVTVCSTLGLWKKEYIQDYLKPPADTNVIWSPACKLYPGTEKVFIGEISFLPRSVIARYPIWVRHIYD